MNNARGIRLLVHPDFLRLERELVERIRRLRSRPDDAVSPILILAPSQRQVQRLRRVLSKHFDGLLGVQVLHHLALAHLLVRNNLTRIPPRVASRLILNELVARLLQGRKDLEVARHTAEHPASVASVAALLREVREAGISPAEMEAVAPSTGGRGLAGLLALYEKALAILGRSPSGAAWTDRAGLLCRAREEAAHLPPYRAVFQYGAYELVGMNLDLVRSLPAEEGLIFLTPADPKAPCWSYARAYFDRHLDVEPELLPDDPAGPRAFVAAARRFRNPEASGAVEEPEIRLVHAQGPEAELNLVAREALALVGNGVAPEEIGIVARSLEPYAPLAETIFARHRLPVDSSLQLPLSRHPKARAWVLLLRALARDFERQTVMDLLRSPLLRPPTPEELRDSRWRPDSWDRWSRSYSLVRGATAWIEDLPAAIAAREPMDWDRESPEALLDFQERKRADTASARVLARRIEQWMAERDAWKACGTARAHAKFLRELASRWILDWEKEDPADPTRSRAVNSTLEGILEDLNSLDSLTEAANAALRAGGRAQTEGAPATGGGTQTEAAQGAGGRAASVPLTLPEVFAFVENGVEEATLPYATPGGVRFLDVMQARGLTFRHLFFIGFNADLLPRRPRETLFLPDRVRRALREKTGRPLAVRRDARDEEWLLLAQTVTAATQVLTVTWQRADADGKARPVSLFLRELARVLPGSPSLRELLQGEGTVVPERVPTHPARAAAFLASRTNLVTREEAALLVCDRHRDPPRALDAFLRGYDPSLAETLALGLNLVRTVDATNDEGAAALRLAYDGFLPEGSGWNRPFSASSLRLLGTCPLQFFFRYVLGVKPLDEGAEEFRFEARELGTVIHKLLERVFGDLRDEGRLTGADAAEDLVAAGKKALERRWNETFDPVARRIRPRFPVLYEAAEDFWRRETEAFLEKDLARLAEGGHTLLGTEESWVEEISLAEGTKPLRETKAPDGPLFDAGFPPDSIPVRGIPDRLTRTADGTWLVSDYKTAGNLQKQVEAKEILCGHRVQIPLYLLLAEARGARQARAELLGLGPAFRRGDGFVKSGPVALEGSSFAETRAGFRESLAVLAWLARQGRFPFPKDSHPCSWCDFRRACRRHHFRSRLRVTGAREYRSYVWVQGKGKKSPFVRDRIGASAGETAP